MSDPAYTAALRAALAAEYAAEYGYGVVGAHSTGVARRQAQQSLAWHHAQQAPLAAAIVSAGGADVLPEPGYLLPTAVRTAKDAARLAVLLEERVCAAYADLVAAAPLADRVTAAQSLATTATWQARWSGRAEPFPGSADLG